MSPQQITDDGMFRFYNEDFDSALSKFNDTKLANQVQQSWDHLEEQYIKASDKTHILNEMFHLVQQARLVVKLAEIRCKHD